VGIEGVLRARTPVCPAPAQELYPCISQLAREIVLESCSSLLTHAPVVLLVAEQAVEEDDGSIALLRIILARLGFVLVVGELDSEKWSGS
jgi:hypothetical protein